MNERDNTEIWTAVAVGALVGIGTALIVRARQDDEVHDIVRTLRRVRPRAEKTVKKARRSLDRQADQAVDAGEELVRAGRVLLDEFKEEATGIVRRTRRDLERAARDTLAQAHDRISRKEPVKEARGLVEEALKRARRARGTRG
jgi:gas vesicle protein